VLLLLFVILGCNIAFSGLAAYIVVREVPGKFVTYFLFGEYLAAMFPISIVAVLEPQTASTPTTVDKTVANQRLGESIAERLGDMNNSPNQS